MSASSLKCFFVQAIAFIPYKNIYVRKRENVLKIVCIQLSMTAKWKDLGAQHLSYNMNKYCAKFDHHYTKYKATNSV